MKKTTVTSSSNSFIVSICYTWKFSAYAFMIVISTQLIRHSLHIYTTHHRFFCLFRPSKIVCKWDSERWECARPCNYICCLNMWNLLWYSRCSTLFFHNRRCRRRWYNSTMFNVNGMNGWMSECILNRLLFGHWWYMQFICSALYKDDACRVSYNVFWLNF